MLLWQIFVPDYNVSVAELVIPGADLSQHIRFVSTLHEFDIIVSFNLRVLCYLTKVALVMAKTLMLNDKDD